VEVFILNSRKRNLAFADHYRVGFAVQYQRFLTYRYRSDCNGCYDAMFFEPTKSPSGSSYAHFGFHRWRKLQLIFSTSIFGEIYGLVPVSSDSIAYANIGSRNSHRGIGVSGQYAPPGKNQATVRANAASPSANGDEARANYIPTALATKPESSRYLAEGRESLLPGEKGGTVAKRRSFAATRSAARA
jgi:hypothetical protein